MSASGIHRLIEHHAAIRADSIALIDGDRTMTYRELNHRANAVARSLIAGGFRHGSVAVVKMARSLELAAVLLGVLKAGGAYTWLDGDADTSLPEGVSLVLDESAAEDRYVALDVTRSASAPPERSPNLPILTRAGDVACVLCSGRGSSAVLVPHATITALSLQSVPNPAHWSDQPGALALWIALMAGSTAVLPADRVASAAA